MEPGLLQTAGAVAGVAGIALVVFLWLFREVIRKNIFPLMTEERGYRTIRLFMILATVVALAGIGAWTLAQGEAGPPRPPKRTLTVRLSRVELDWEGPTAAAEEFEGREPSGLDDFAVDAAARWVLERLAADDVMSAHDAVAITLSLPADFSKQNPSLVISPPVEWSAYVAVVGGGEKSRVPAGDSKKGWREVGTWAPAAETWDLQIVPHGHEQVGVELAGGPAKARSVRLPSPRVQVALALRDADGTAEPAADRVMLRLIPDGRVKLTKPEALAALRAELAKSAAAGTSAAAQSTLRSRLGVDYVVTCAVR